MKYLISGHNIKWIAIACIESLMLNAKVNREDIVFFDDNSTDGTREELEKRDIKVITWDKETYNEFKTSVCNNVLTARVSMIMNSAYKQISDDCLVCIDGDMIFTDNPFQEMFRELGDNLVFGIGKIHPDNYANIYQNMCLLRLDELKEIGVLGDDLSRFEKEHYKGKECETGTSFYEKIVKNDVPASIVSDESELADYLLNGRYAVHLGWCSSAMRDDLLFLGNYCDVMNNMKKNLYSKKVLKVLDTIGIDADLIYAEFKKNMRKSNAFT